MDDVGLLQDPEHGQNTEELYYSQDNDDPATNEMEDWEHKIKAAKERDPDKPNPCTLSGWELLFEFGVIEPTVRCRVCPSA